MLPVFWGLASCGNYDFAHPVVQQGNLLSPSVVQRLSIGMTKEDAAILLGTSLLSPLFNDDRWDYAYTRRLHGQDAVAKHVVLYFQHHRLVRIEAG